MWSSWKSTTFINWLLSTIVPFLVYLKTMKLFRTFRTNFNRIGISANEPIINRKSVLSYLFFGLNSIFYFAFLFHEAKSFREYTDSIYMTTATLLFAISFTIVSLIGHKIFSLIEFAEKFFGESELQYHRIQLWFGIVKVIFLFIFRINTHEFECKLYRNISTNRKME